MSTHVISMYTASRCSTIEYSISMAQDYSNSCALAMDFLQYCTKSSICMCIFVTKFQGKPLQIRSNCFRVRCGWLDSNLFQVMVLLPDTQNCECACAGNAGNVFPATAGKRSRHASRHVRDARAVMHAGIAN